MMTIASLALAGMASIAYSQEGSAARERAAAEASRTVEPEWPIVDEHWLPLRFESATALDSARFHYRRNEEVAAANEIRKAISWIRLAADHALPITKEKLRAAETDLSALAKDVEAGNLSDAARLDASLARASQALAEYHFFEAKETFGSHQAAYAAQNLEAAVTHLEHAANSAHHQYGPETIGVFNEVLKHSNEATQKRLIDNEVLSKQMDGVEKAMKELADALRKAG